MASLIEHLEKYLGAIDCGWSVSAEGDAMDFQVVKFALPGSHQVAYSTLGLSKIPLRSTVSGKMIRQELFLLAPEGFGDQNIPAVLQNVAAEAIGLDRAYLRGEVIGPRGSLFDGLPFTAFYVTLPVYLPDSFQQFQGDEGHTVVFGWLVPITASELQFVAAHGWEKFEDLLEQRNPDLVDYARSAVA
jgi:hypothetical protein